MAVVYLGNSSENVGRVQGCDDGLTQQLFMWGNMITDNKMTDNDVILSRDLGDFKISELGLGGAALGNLFQPVTNEDALQTIEAALGLHINYIDTAPFYGFGISERRIGDMLRPLPRDSFVLSTKVGRLLVPDEGRDINQVYDGYATPMPFRPEYDYSYDGIMRSHEASLHRLGLSKIDILLVHDIGEVTHGVDNLHHMKVLEQSGYRALEELRANGDIKYIGLGVNEWQVCEAVMEFGHWDCFLMAGRYTLMEQTVLDSFFPKCEAHGAKIIIGGAYNSGILATGTKGPEPVYYNYEVAPPEVINHVRAIEEVTEAHNVTLAAAALQFPLAHPLVKSVVPGLRSVGQVKATWDLYREQIPNAFWSDLLSAGLIDVRSPLPKGESHAD
ncbi:aldo/keto reductase [Kordiimonas sp. SCSIO 12610]|uniref:aldo/keto reductase n=1 Tax=Kordiimonas sp. SCSIO 12610 TaxID=2829597 RepID=UPI00210C9A23|nr:aldo/keto reductase [Kordiimonas sp. SCSIO 12610]UTW54689.1 aldo/keto reductase [Kordiimonas sp. SCSIO 12610]